MDKWNSEGKLDKMQMSVNAAFLEERIWDVVRTFEKNNPGAVVESVEVRHMDGEGKRTYDRNKIARSRGVFVTLKHEHETYKDPEEGRSGEGEGVRKGEKEAKESEKVGEGEAGGSEGEERRATKLLPRIGEVGDQGRTRRWDDLSEAWVDSLRPLIV